MQVSRRQFLSQLTDQALGIGAGLAGSYVLGDALTQPASAMNSLPAQTARARPLVAVPAMKNVAGSQAPDTSVWTYDGQVPGPVLAVQVGERLQIAFDNHLPQPTTVHWHGLRVPNAMDGVPELTQALIMPGQSFPYDFPVRNSGTYWYHPHFATSEQLDRGLHGVIVVPEPQPPEVDRELVWVLDDWRLDNQARIVADFDDRHDASHQGRFGNTATINGTVPGDVTVHAGERVRLRLVNVANAWIFGLQFNGHQPLIVAYDGHPVTPHAPPEGLVTIGPAQRVDVIVDMTEKSGQRFEVSDRYYERSVYKLTDLVYLRDGPSHAGTRKPVKMPKPDLPAPLIANAQRHEIRFSGGAMGGMRAALFQGKQTGMRALASAGKMWAINGIVASGNDDPPLLNLEFGRSYLLEFVNDTAFPHPIHLHGHPFQVLTLGARTLREPVWRDTLLMAANSKATVALVADNPGKWMLHCHIPEHLAAGMMAVVSVA